MLGYYDYGYKGHSQSFPSATWFINPTNVNYTYPKTIIIVTNNYLKNIDQKYHFKGFVIYYR